MLAEIHFTLEILLLLFGIAGAVLGVRIVRRLDDLDEPALSVQLFLRAPLVRRYIQLFSIAVVLFVLVPLTDLGKLVTNTEEIEILHDVSNLVFVATALVGLVGLDRILGTRTGPRAGTSPAIAEKRS